MTSKKKIIDINAGETIHTKNNELHITKTALDSPVFDKEKATPTADMSLLLSEAIYHIPDLNTVRGGLTQVLDHITNINGSETSKINNI